jgi:general secretion pathway protein G
MHSPLTHRRSVRRRHRSAPGFTLTEILIAIALIVLLVSVAVANLSGVFSSGQEQTARIFVTDGIDTPLLTYKMNTGSYPTTEQGLQSLITAPEGVSGWKGPYLTTADVPKDPWGHPYQYEYPSQKVTTGGYAVWSMGPDGMNGTADDIGNWQK